jgi:hypothetical protein
MAEAMITKDFRTYAMKSFAVKKVFVIMAVSWATRCDPTSHVYDDASRATWLSDIGRS